MVSRRVVPIALVLGFSISGCYGEVYTPVEQPSVIASVSYEPLYYRDDYIVYYDDQGAPYYYLDGRVRLIGETDPSYRLYVNHYRTHAAEYRRWVASTRNARYEHRSQWMRARTARRH